MATGALADPTWPTLLFLHMQTYSYKDAWAAIPKPGEENRKKWSKVCDYLQAYYVPDGLNIMQRPHLICTTAESRCHFPYFTIKDICLCNLPEVTQLEGEEPGLTLRTHAEALFTKLGKIFINKNKKKKTSPLKACLRKDKTWDIANHHLPSLLWVLGLTSRDMILFPPGLSLCKTRPPPSKSQPINPTHPFSSQFFRPFRRQRSSGTSWP